MMFFRTESNILGDFRLLRYSSIVSGSFVKQNIFKNVTTQHRGNLHSSVDQGCRNTRVNLIILMKTRTHAHSVRWCVIGWGFLKGDNDSRSLCFPDNTPLARLMFQLYITTTNVCLDSFIDSKHVFIFISVPSVFFLHTYRTKTLIYINNYKLPQKYYIHGYQSGGMRDHYNVSM